MLSQNEQSLILLKFQIEESEFYRIDLFYLNKRNILHQNNKGGRNRIDVMVVPNKNYTRNGFILIKFKVLLVNLIFSSVLYA